MKQKDTQNESYQEIHHTKPLFMVSKSYAALNRPSWLIHCVYGKSDVSFHTHGLGQYNSLELELNLPIDENHGARA